MGPLDVLNYMGMKAHVGASRVQGLNEWQVVPASFTIHSLPGSRSWSATINGEEKRLREQYLVMVQRPKPVQ